MFTSFTPKTVAGDNCCSVQPKAKAACPQCSKLAKGVLEKTFNALVKEETKSQFSCRSGFYYCKTPSCKVIYFRDDTILTQQDMKVIVGLKDGASVAMVCYCFQWSKEKIAAEIQATGKTTALEDIKAKMKDPGCACEVLNPSGGCCLGDVAKAIREIQS